MRKAPESAPSRKHPAGEDSAGTVGILKRPYFPALLCVSTAAFVSALDSSIVNVSLPTVARSFGVQGALGSEVVLAYLLFLSGMLLFFGRLADIVGASRIFRWGMLLFSCASLLCGAALSLNMLVLSRAIQGVGGAMLTVTAFALVPFVAPRERRGEAFGLLAMMASAGTIIGAPLGGFLTGTLSWRWIFLINLPVGALATFAALRLLPADEERHPFRTLRHRIGELDLPGSVASFLGFLALLIALNRGSQLGWSSPSILGAFLAAAILLALFTLREVRTPVPLMDLSLFRNRDFSLAIAGGVPAYLVFGAVGILMPFLLQNYKGLSPQQAGTVLLLYSLTYMSTAYLAGRLADRLSPKLVCFGGMALATGACLFIATTLSSPGMGHVILFLVGIAASFGLFLSPNNAFVMSSVPGGKRGGASGIFSTSSRLSLTIGVSLFEALYVQCLGGSIATEAMAAAFRTVWFTAAVLCGAGALCALLSLRSVSRHSSHKTESGDAEKEIPLV